MKRILCLTLAILLLGAQALAEPAADRAVVDFSLKLLAQAAASGEPNVVVSPVSAYLALAMAGAGARGDTAAQFAAALGLDAEALPAACAELTGALSDAEGSTVLAVANSGWLDERFAADPAYLRLIGEMDADVFVRALATDSTRREINRWVSEKTRSLIPTLLDGNLSEDAALALINTLYFNGVWESRFDPDDTHDDAFTRADGSEVYVPFMRLPEGNLKYIASDGAEGALLPYNDGKTALLALRPTDGRTARELIAALTPEALAGYAAAAADAEMVLMMPKFTLSYSVTMNDMLMAMGLGLAFDPDNADFTGMGTSPKGNIYISTVLQKVKIGVNEKGTKAAAATAIIMADAAAAPPESEPPTLKLDTPFAYAVIDLQTGIPLFVGCLDDPSLSEGD